MNRWVVLGLVILLLGISSNSTDSYDQDTQYSNSTVEELDYIPTEIPSPTTHIILPTSTPSPSPSPFVLPTFSPGYWPSTFNGYYCTDDCSGHEAGYEWAEENDIDDEYDCDGNSDSFNEGCQSYVEENYPMDEEEGYDYEY